MAVGHGPRIEIERQALAQELRSNGSGPWPKNSDRMAGFGPTHELSSLSTSIMRIRIMIATFYVFGE